MTHPLAVARPSDVDTIRAVLDSGRSIARSEARLYGLPDRRLRAAIAALRAEGYPAIADSAEGSVYRRARTYREVEEFVRSELLSRARNLELQANAMLEQARLVYAAEQMAFDLAVAM